MEEYKLEQFIWENPELIESGLKVIDRQRRIETGQIDLLCKDKAKNYVIVELKIDPEHDSVSQIAKYIIGLMKEGIPREKIRAILVTRTVSRNLKELCDFFNIETKGLAIGMVKKDTNKKPTNTQKEENEYKHKNPLELAINSIDSENNSHYPGIHLSRNEAEIVKIILTFNKNNQYATYPDISKSRNITVSCIRGYISGIVAKGVPIHKKKLKNNRILLFIKEEKKQNLDGNEQIDNKTEDN